MSPDYGAGRRRLLWARNAALIAATLALWLAGIGWPFAPVAGVDPSWQTALSLAHLRGLQFGTDVQFTYGPWGFLGLNFCAPELLGLKLAWEVFGGLALSATVVLVSGEMPGMRRWVFLAAFLSIACFNELAILALITLLGVAWLVPATSRAWQRALAVACLAFLAQGKFTFCVAAAAGVAVAAAVAWAERSRRAALALAGAYALAYLACWLGARQHLGNLVPYWRQSWQLSAGYGAAMFLDPAPLTLAAGLATALLAAGVLWRVLGVELPRARRAGAVLVLACGWLIAWKEAFTRADLHVLAFFAFSFVMAFALHGLLPRGRVLRLLLVLTALAALAGVRSLGPGWLANGPSVAWQRLRTRPRELLDLGAVRAGYMGQLEASRRVEADPDLRGRVGGDSIDALTIDNSRVVLNGLNYRPRPLIQSYSAYTPSLSEANARFFRSEGAPLFVAVTLSTIDGHPAGLDDGPALAEIVRRYELVKFTPDYALVRRRAVQAGPGAPAYPLISSVAPRFGEEIAVPGGGGHPVWMDVDFPATLLGRLRTLLYHAAELRMVVSGGIGENVSYRILPGMSRSGFFVQPWLDNHGDFASLVNGRANDSLRTVRFECASGTLFWGPPKVRFSSVADLPLGR